MKVSVLRLGHRIARDKRISTHCALVARAFGAREILYSGEHDKGLEDSVNNVVENWGGIFQIKFTKNWLKTIKDFKNKKWLIVHLTVYGLPFQNKLKEVRKSKNLLVIIGGEKVPSEIYEFSDWNLSVTSQPQSEVGALSVFLHELFEGKELSLKFKKAKRRVIPQERGKKVINLP